MQMNAGQSPDRERRRLYECEMDWREPRYRARVAKHLNDWGVALIRNFLPPTLAIDLDDFIRGRFEAAQPEDLTPSNPEDMWARVLDERLFLRLYRHCRESGLTDEIEFFLGDEAIAVIEATVSIRQVKPKSVTEEFFGWHQDSASFHWAPKHRFVSCWCALTDAARSAPGLAVIAARLRGLAGPSDSSHSITLAELDGVCPIGAIASSSPISGRAI